MNKLFRFVVGLVFLLSALLKAIDAASFADLMSQYGAQWFGFGAPVIILVEVILAVAFIFDVQPRRTSIGSIFFLCFVSVIYLYGILFKGITDCGCFGPLTWLSTKPWLTFLRNGILCGLLIPSMIKPQQGTALSLPVIAFLAITGIIIMFMSGYSLNGAKCLQKKSKTFEPVPLHESALADLVSCSEDSTYLVFAFSYHCPYCQNSIGNVNQYQQMGYVDKVIGIAVEDAEARERFDRLFETNFTIQEVSQWTMAHLTQTLPTVYIIRHDSIISQYSGMVLSPALLLP